MKKIIFLLLAVVSSHKMHTANEDEVRGVILLAASGVAARSAYNLCDGQSNFLKAACSAGAGVCTALCIAAIPEKKVVPALTTVTALSCVAHFVHKRLFPGERFVRYEGFCRGHQTYTSKSGRCASSWALPLVIGLPLLCKTKSYIATGAGLLTVSSLVHQVLKSSRGGTEPVLPRIPFNGFPQDSFTQNTFSSNPFSQSSSSQSSFNQNQAQGDRQTLNALRVLGLQNGATEQEIKRAYRQLALRWHPDRHSQASETNKKEAEEKFKKIKKAYEDLGGRA